MQISKYISKSAVNPSAVLTLTPCNAYYIELTNNYTIQVTATRYLWQCQEDDKTGTLRTIELSVSVRDTSKITTWHLTCCTNKDVSQHQIFDDKNSLSKRNTTHLLQRNIRFRRGKASKYSMLGPKHKRTTMGIGRSFLWLCRHDMLKCK